MKVKELITALVESDRLNGEVFIENNKTDKTWAIDSLISFGPDIIIHLGDRLDY